MTIAYEDNLPFKEWQERAQLMPVEEGAAALDVDRDYFPEETTDLLVYPGGCYIECLKTGDYFLQIAAEEWQGFDLERLERALYNEWYVQ